MSDGEGSKAGASDPVEALVLDVAMRVADAPDGDVARELLQLQDVLASAPAGSKESGRIKQLLWYYELVQYLILVLEKDYSRTQEGWPVAAQIAQILSTCCVGLKPLTDAEEFHSQVLPAALEGMLLLARRLQARMLHARKEEEKNGFLRNFQSVVDSICWLFGGHIELTSRALKSEHLQQLLITDDTDTACSTMSLIQNVLRTNRGAVGEVDEKTMNAILDELVYKLAVTSDPRLGGGVARVLLCIAESHHPIIASFSTRFKGLQLLLNMWIGKGFEKDFRRLLDLLSAGSNKQAELQHLHKAASVVQSAWRAYRARCRLKKLPHAVTYLQRSFRQKREKERLQSEQQQQQEELRQELIIRRQRAMRTSRQRRLLLLEIVPANEMDRYLAFEATRAAVLIQARWRGFQLRKAFRRDRQLLLQAKAAVTIQRAVRRFLERRHSQQTAASSRSLGWRGMSDARRMELRAHIEEHIQKHPATPMHGEEARELHNHAQALLGQFLLQRQLGPRSEQRRAATLAQINTQAELLANIPIPAQASPRDVEALRSRSGPVAARARQAHSLALRSLRRAWWQRLGEESSTDPDQSSTTWDPERELELAGV
ncbi:IQ calmodulin-binding motif-containing protein 1-like [Lampetra planeri]